MGRVLVVLKIPYSLQFAVILRVLYIQRHVSYMVAEYIGIIVLFLTIVVITLITVIFLFDSSEDGAPLSCLAQEAGSGSPNASGFGVRNAKEADAP